MRTGNWPASSATRGQWPLQELLCGVGVGSQIGLTREVGTGSRGGEGGRLINASLSSKLQALDGHELKSSSAGPGALGCPSEPELWGGSDGGQLHPSWTGELCFSVRH